MSRSWALGFLGIASVAALVAPFAGGALAGALMAAAAVGFPIALIVLGAGRAWRRRGLRLGLAALGAVLVLAAAYVVVASPSETASNWVWGLPAATWVMLLGLCLGPLALTVAVHAATFEPGGRAR